MFVCVFLCSHNFPYALWSSRVIFCVRFYSISCAFCSKPRTHSEFMCSGYPQYDANNDNKTNYSTEEQKKKYTSSVFSSLQYLCVCVLVYALHNKRSNTINRTLATLILVDLAAMPKQPLLFHLLLVLVLADGLFCWPFALKAYTHDYVQLKTNINIIRSCSLTHSHIYTPNDRSVCHVQLYVDHVLCDEMNSRTDYAHDADTYIVHVCILYTIVLFDTGAYEQIPCDTTPNATQHLTVCALSLYVSKGRPSKRLLARCAIFRTIFSYMCQNWREGSVWVFKLLKHQPINFARFNIYKM